MGTYQGMCPAFGAWWIFPLLMIVFCVLMMFMMRARMPRMMQGMMDRQCLGTNPEGRAPVPAETAREILDKRYAQGEIDKDEYETKKEDLRKP